eukprot:CAMPEP_0180581532 /NCGR_PEP_ID=MMETSP1037_2-20121125/14098_1 /TAXON_ID=632150 /ORGANISM="Azadinium spinosum, Strain 3D9" /LENGTH=96 /DNA_ID=CAMNT_0022599513 /DNA_START=305 /DNA_END=592 /DNA_ORIENTATION=-
MLKALLASSIRPWPQSRLFQARDIDAAIFNDVLRNKPCSQAAPRGRTRVSKDEPSDLRARPLAKNCALCAVKARAAKWRELRNQNSGACVPSSLRQ